MNNTIYLIAVITVIAIVTWALRAFPFLLFGSRPSWESTSSRNYDGACNLLSAGYKHRTVSLWGSGIHCLCINCYPANLKEKHVFVYHCRNCFLYVFNSCCVNTESRLIPQFLHS